MRGESALDRLPLWVEIGLTTLLAESLPRPICTRWPSCMQQMRSNRSSLRPLPENLSTCLGRHANGQSGQHRPDQPSLHRDPRWPLRQKAGNRTRHEND